MLKFVGCWVRWCYRAPTICGKGLIVHRMREFVFVFDIRSTVTTVATFHKSYIKRGHVGVCCFVEDCVCIITEWEVFALLTCTNCNHVHVREAPRQPTNRCFSCVPQLSVLQCHGPLTLGLVGEFHFVDAQFLYIWWL